VAVKTPLQVAPPPRHRARLVRRRGRPHLVSSALWVARSCSSSTVPWGTSRGQAVPARLPGLWVPGPLGAAREPAVAAPPAGFQLLVSARSSPESPSAALARGAGPNIAEGFSRDIR